MTQAGAEFVTTALSGYALLGIGVAGPFVLWGVRRIDPLARHASKGFCLLIGPGVVLFWPLLLVRWYSGSIAPPVELNAHRLRARRAR